MENSLPDSPALLAAVAPAAPDPSAAPAEKPVKPAKAAVSLLVKAAEAYVISLLEKNLSGTCTYHTVQHTELVAKEARALATAAELPKDDTEHMLLAAWFHDTGYLDAYDGHEYRSMTRAAEWLTAQSYPAAGIAVVTDLIRATHRNEAAPTELHKMLVDADMSNLAQEDFQATAELLRAEWEAALGKTYSNPQWAELQINFMLAHKYHSEVGKDRYKKQFKANLKEQRDTLKKLEKKTRKRDEARTETFAEPKRGIETMFRTMYSNHMKLSDMADKKASMMIQLNAVLISVIITYLGAKMGKAAAVAPLMSSNPALTVPITILLITALGSVTTAILSAQPDVTAFNWLKRNPAIATNRRVNLLFFGQFTKLSLDDFQSGMRELMRQKDALYINMTTDVYYLGKVLNRKYSLLRTSYSIFMVGLILTALSFGIVLAYKS